MPGGPMLRNVEELQSLVAEFETVKADPMENIGEWEEMG